MSCLVISDDFLDVFVRSKPCFLSGDSESANAGAVVLSEGTLAAAAAASVTPAAQGSSYDFCTVS